jgi:hypothetical protein
LAKKARSPYVGELRDPDGISTENHQEMTERLVKAGRRGIHNPPTERPPRKHGN